MGFYIDMIDVDQGDSFLLTLSGSSRDYTFLVDAGPPGAGQRVARFVNENAAGRLDAIIATHLDIDHIGGMSDIIDGCQVGLFFMNTPPDPRMSLRTLLRQRLIENVKSGADWDRVEKSLEAATELVEALRARHLLPRPILAGQYWNLGEIAINVLSPTQERLGEAWKEIEEEEVPFLSIVRELMKSAGLGVAPVTTAMNNASVVLEIVYRGQPHALLASDAGADVLKEVTGGRQYPLLKVPHHGGKTGMDDLLVAQVRPRTAFISVGDNPHGHPAIEVLDMLREVGAKTYCSNRTRHCRRDCPPAGFGSICHRHDRGPRPGWTTVDASRCENNR